MISLCSVEIICSRPRTPLVGLPRFPANAAHAGGNFSTGAAMNKTKRIGKRKHGHCINDVRSSEYESWCGMIRRCCNPKNPDFKYYGGRGIKICPRWRESFQSFFDDMGTKPTLKHSLDRFPDGNGNYEPSNCRWATQWEQIRNKRGLHRVRFRGETLLLSDWARKIGLSPGALSVRLKKWGKHRALTTPPMIRNRALGK